MSTVGHYPTDVHDAQWEVLQLVLPPPTWRPGGPGRKPLDRRRVINGIFYVKASIIASATLESALWTSRSGRQID